MHVFVYEWVAGGGLLAHTGPLPEPLLTQGLAMAEAVAEDLSRAGRRVTLLRDLRVTQMSGRGAELVTVDSRATHDEHFGRLARECDAVLMIAPETDGELSACVAAAEAAGARLVSPGSGFVAIAGEKHRCADHLLGAGVAAPRGLVLDAGDPLPVDFPYPAVVKPIDGAGSEDIYVVAGPHDTPPAYAGTRRLEPLVAGKPVSVSVLTGPGGSVALPATEQRLSADGRLRYLGGATGLPRGQVGRAQRLALDAVEALPPTRGYVGVDLVLGADPTGGGDRVIEVNPRLTTSYAALRFAVEQNLADAMLAVAAGEQASLDPIDRALEFGVDGVVSYLD